MQPHQARVIREKSDLDKKIEDLDAFGRCEAFRALQADEQYRLGKQLEVMEAYSKILGERIAAFGPLKVFVMVNGINKEVTASTLTYEDLVAMANYPHGSTPSCMWGCIGDQSRGGILSSGQALAIMGNEYFNVIDTGNA